MPGGKNQEHQKCSFVEGLELEKKKYIETENEYNLLLQCSFNLLTLLH